jgi:hypothetical protein
VLAQVPQVPSLLAGVVTRDMACSWGPGMWSAHPFGVIAGWL